MRVGIIGDVHGHLRELKAMVRMLESFSLDRLILLGDLCDRGPESLACLRFAHEEGFLNRQSHVRPIECIKGNHEDAYVRIRRGKAKPGRSRVESPEDRRLYALLPHHILDWMEALPVYIEVPELNLLCLHGGVTPHYDSLEHGGEYMLRVRYLDDRYYERGFVGDIFWAEVYDGRFGTIVFGHESHRRPTHYSNALAIDGEGYRKMHAAIFSNEDRTPVVTFTCDYGLQPRMVEPSYDPIRFHDFSGKLYR